MMSEILGDAQPVAVFVPIKMTTDGAVTWRSEILSELVYAGIVGDANRADWEAVLQETAAAELPEQASGMLLLAAHNAVPVYLWATLAQPPGNPAALGEAILDSQFPNQERGDWTQFEESDVGQGSRIGRHPSDPSIFTQVCVTVATLTVEGVGATDVCLWFGTSELDAVDQLLPVVANLMRDPDLAAYLVA